MNKYTAFGGYALGDPRTTARLDRLVGDTPVDPERDWTIRARNEDIYTEAIRRWFKTTDANTIHGGDV